MTNFKWPKRITIIRHGQSEQNAILDLLDKNLGKELEEQKKIRDADIKLTKLGIKQAKETGKYLSKTEKFDVCFTSPYLRATQTAKNIVDNIGYDLEIFEDFRLREKEFGRLHGYTNEEIREKYPEEFEDRKRDGKLYYRLPRGENYLDVGDRMHHFLDKLHRDYKNKSVLIITHQIPYIMLRALFDRLNESQILKLETVPNCGIQEFFIDTGKHSDGRMKLSKFNYVVYKK